MCATEARHAAASGTVCLDSVGQSEEKKNRVLRRVAEVTAGQAEADVIDAYLSVEGNGINDGPATSTFDLILSERLDRKRPEVAETSQPPASQTLASSPQCQGAFCSLVISCSCMIHDRDD